MNISFSSPIEEYKSLCLQVRCMDSFDSSQLDKLLKSALNKKNVHYDKDVEFLFFINGNLLKTTIGEYCLERDVEIKEIIFDIPLILPDKIQDIHTDCPVMALKFCGKWLITVSFAVNIYDSESMEKPMVNIDLNTLFMDHLEIISYDEINERIVFAIGGQGGYILSANPLKGTFEKLFHLVKPDYYNVRSMKLNGHKEFLAMVCSQNQLSIWSTSEEQLDIVKTTTIKKKRKVDGDVKRQPKILLNSDEKYVEWLNLPSHQPNLLTLSSGNQTSINLWYVDTEKCEPIVSISNPFCTILQSIVPCPTDPTLLALSVSDGTIHFKRISSIGNANNRFKMETLGNMTPVFKNHGQNVTLQWSLCSLNSLFVVATDSRVYLYHPMVNEHNVVTTFGKASPMTIAVSYQSNNNKCRMIACSDNTKLRIIKY